MEKLEINDDNIASEYFKKFVGDKNKLNEDEYYKCISCYLTYQLGKDEWTSKLKNEKYFNVYLNEGENEIGFDNFVNSFKDLEVLTFGNIVDNHENDLEIDFTL